MDRFGNDNDCTVPPSNGTAVCTDDSGGTPQARSHSAPTPSRRSPSSLFSGSDSVVPAAGSSGSGADGHGSISTSTVGSSNDSNDAVAEATAVGLAVASAIAGAGGGGRGGPHSALVSPARSAGARDGGALAAERDDEDSCPPPPIVSFDVAGAAAADSMLGVGGGGGGRGGVASATDNNSESPQSESGFVGSSGDLVLNFSPYPLGVMPDPTEGRGSRGGGGAGGVGGALGGGGGSDIATLAVGSPTEPRANPPRGRAGRSVNPVDTMPLGFGRRRHRSLPLPAKLPPRRAMIPVNPPSPEEDTPMPIGAPMPL